MKVPKYPNENNVDNVRRMRMKPLATINNMRYPEATSAESYKVIVKSETRDKRTLMAAEFRDVLNLIHVRESAQKKSGASVTGWYTVTIKNCSGVSNEAIMLALNYVLVPVAVNPYNFKRASTQDGDCVQFVVDNTLMANRLKRLKTAVAVLYTCQPLDIHVAVGLPVNVKSPIFSPSLLDALKVTLHGRYNAQTKTLNLSCFHAAAELREKFLALSVTPVLERVLQLLSLEFPELVELNLSDNFLETLRAFDAMATKLPSTLQQLDFTNNRIEKLSDLIYVRDLRLKSLRLFGNRVAKSKLRELHSLLPNVHMIDGIEADSLCVDPKPTFSLTPNIVSLAKQFVNSFYTLYDNIQCRLKLTQYYDKRVIFSMTTSPDVLSDVSVYRMYDRNLLRLQSPMSRQMKLVESSFQLVRALGCLPETKHNSNGICLDVMHNDRKSCIITISGTFMERQVNAQYWKERSFQRTFVIQKSGNNWLIINDMLTINSKTKGNGAPHSKLLGYDELLLNTSALDIADGTPFDKDINSNNKIMKIGEQISSEQQAVGGSAAVEQAPIRLKQVVQVAVEPKPTVLVTPTPPISPQAIENVMPPLIPVVRHDFDDLIDEDELLGGIESDGALCIDEDYEDIDLL
ncbi:nuclear RNA export factor 1 [Scaptodrosophila lebanonensis]|uniref:Nuclear RNA export factor 1 n=1 Tax=Drosophila lebanonensis TaxID=7225 RepID=A0A6J2TMA8_DROLE|nr:nuclear RNA export factor 1 [Scaptodrosophila lebanonensis]